MSVLSRLVEELQSNQALVDQIPGGLHDEYPPPAEIQEYPLLALRWETDPVLAAHWGMREGRLTISIWDSGNSSVAIEAIKEEIELSLDRRIVTVGERQWVRLAVGSDRQVPDEAGLKRWDIIVTARYFRHNLVERLV